MSEDVYNNEMIKTIQKIEDKYTNKYLRDGFREFFNEVIQEECKDFKEKFFKEVAEIDEELDDFFPENKKRKIFKKKRPKVYSDSEDENEDEKEEKGKK